MSPNNNEVHIYSKKGTKWVVEHVLKEVRPDDLYFSLILTSDDLLLIRLPISMARG